MSHRTMDGFKRVHTIRALPVPPRCRRAFRTLRGPEEAKEPKAVFKVS